MRFLGFALPALIALAAGIALPAQAGVNTQLRTLLGTPLRAAFVSFAIGTALLAIVVVLTRGPWPAAHTLAKAPWWVWAGGAIGAFYVAATVIVVPRLGSAYAFGLIVAGQMAASIAIDRFGLFGVAPTALSPARIAGAALVAGGVFLLRK
jgi:transporter family-2 protein